ncbi:hypothetical protein Acr_21g0010860 [Actinidia rufa]|uniref:Uncharacterized protein n=1 Tax=Actinidia rufa TaxID=165716 RepID=A0A7J0GI53_9ERIC|nr:hypothetical protein Acr_21g0010860 [Actinidia rufa]
MRFNPKGTKHNKALHIQVMCKEMVVAQKSARTFDVLFQVLDVLSAYNFLLCLLWVHSASAVPSSLHQKIKYIAQDHMITINAEDDLTVLQSPAIPYVDVENNVAHFIPLKTLMPM